MCFKVAKLIIIIFNPMKLVKVKGHGWHQQRSLGVFLLCFFLLVLCVSVFLLVFFSCWVLLLFFWGGRGSVKVVTSEGKKVPVLFSMFLF